MAEREIGFVRVRGLSNKRAHRRKTTSQHADRAFDSRPDGRRRPRARSAPSTGVKVVAESHRNEVEPYDACDRGQRAEQEDAGYAHFQASTKMQLRDARVGHDDDENIADRIRDGEHEIDPQVLVDAVWGLGGRIPQDDGLAVAGAELDGHERDGPHCDDDDHDVVVLPEALLDFEDPSEEE